MSESIRSVDCQGIAVDTIMERLRIMIVHVPIVSRDFCWNIEQDYGSVLYMKRKQFQTILCQH